MSYSQTGRLMCFCWNMRCISGGWNDIALYCSGGALGRRDGSSQWSSGGVLAENSGFSWGASLWQQQRSYALLTIYIYCIYNWETNEWMNEWGIYIALYCVWLYTQSALQSCGGGSLLNHHQCAASTWMMWRQPQDNGASALTTHQLQVERRER